MRRSRPVSAALTFLFLLLSLAGCSCLPARLQTVIAPPEPTRAEERQIERLMTAAPRAALAAPIDRQRLDAEHAERCDVIDPARCLLPFPNDHFTVEDTASPTGRRVAFERASMPRNHFGKVIDPEAWGASDGFSPGPLILAYLGEVDLEASAAPTLRHPERSLDAASPIQLLDAETGERQLVWAELDAQAAPGERLLMVHAATNLREGRRYLVALQRLVDADGAPIPASAGFRLYRDAEPHGAPAIEARRPDFEELFARLGEAGLERRELVLAWGFTVASSEGLSRRLLHMRDDAFAALGDEAPDFKVLCVDDEPEGDEERLARRVWGSYRVPTYLEGKGKPGSRLRLGAGGLPERTGTARAYFSCIVPEGALAEPARIALYGHGVLGSLDEVAAGDVQAMADEHNFVFCATNWSGQSLVDYLQVLKFLADASEFPAVADRVHQGILNTLYLGRLMLHPDGLAAHEAFRDAGGRPLLDTSELFYDGNSQGALFGGTASAVAQDWRRAVLGVAGMRYSLILPRSASFAEPRVPVLPGLGEVFDRSYAAIDRPLVLALVQVLWDRVDLNGHARHLVSDPYPGTPAKELLVHVAFGDQAVPMVASEVLARTLGERVPVRAPALLDGRAGYPTAFETLEDDLGPEREGSALIVWDSGTCPTPLENLTPEKDDDPHAAVRRQLAARRQKADFLRSDGRVVEVCGDDPCFACGGPPCEEICREAP